MYRKLKLILIIIVSAFSMQIKAQDPVFTQFFAVPETMNPGFTGFTNAIHAGILHRRQWPDANRRLDTDLVFANKMISDRSGVGIIILNHHEQFTNYNFSEVSVAYSYAIRLNYNWGFSPGIQVGWGLKNFQFKNLLLEDQINTNTGEISGGSTDPEILHSKEHINFPDITAGFEMNNEVAWFGAALKHLNRPDISFRDEKNVQLDMFLTIHGGYYFEFEDAPSSLFEDSRIMVMANYMRQSQYNRLDLGTGFESGLFTLGAIAAINPERKSSYSHLVTSVNPFATFHLGEFDFGYSYDLNTSRIEHTQGVHELSIIWTYSHTCESCDNYKVKLKRNGDSGYVRN